QRHCFPYAFVLHGAESSRVHLAVLGAARGGDQALRPEQAADVVGVKKLAHRLIVATPRPLAPQPRTRMRAPGNHAWPRSSSSTTRTPSAPSSPSRCKP